jgi:hypothetical protein
MSARSPVNPRLEAPECSVRRDRRSGGAARSPLWAPARRAMTSGDRARAAETRWGGTEPTCGATARSSLRPRRGGAARRGDAAPALPRIAARDRRRGGLAHEGPESHALFPGPGTRCERRAAWGWMRSRSLRGHAGARRRRRAACRIRACGHAARLPDRGARWAPGSSPAHRGRWKGLASWPRAALVERGDVQGRSARGTRTRSRAGRVALAGCHLNPTGGGRDWSVRRVRSTEMSASMGARPLPKLIAVQSCAPVVRAIEGGASALGGRRDRGERAARPAVRGPAEVHPRVAERRSWSRTMLRGMADLAREAGCFALRAARRAPPGARAEDRECFARRDFNTGSGPGPEAWHGAVPRSDPGAPP